MPGSGTELNCTAQDGPISADADIVGPGVLAAFLVSSGLTVFAVFAGYLSGSLGDEYMTHFDRAIIKSARLHGQAFKRLVGLRPPLEETLAQAELQPRSSAWKHAVSRFILSLSDQQLVTGLAILVAGVSNQKTLTFWEFRVALSLAWFSTTSHLATLDALRTYLESKPIIRHMRVFGMTVVLFLLLYMFILNLFPFFSSGKHETVLVQCVFHPEILPMVVSIPVFEILVNTIPLLVVVFGYYVRISELYWGHWIPPFASKLLFGRKVPLPLKNLEGQDPAGCTRPRLLVADLLEARQASARAGKLGNIAQTRLQISTDPSQRLNRLHLHATGALLLGTGSFFSSLASIAFSLSYGIAQLVAFRWTGAPLLQEDAVSMGFGQIMAIFLLVLLPLAAIESYYDYTESMSRSWSRHAQSAEPPAAQPGDPDLVFSTAPSQLPTDSFMDMADPKAIDDAYTRRCKYVKRYLAFDVALLAHLEANYNDSQADQKALVVKKKKLLIRYQELWKVETSIPLFGATGLMGGLFVNNVLLGALSDTLTSGLLFIVMMFILSLLSGMPGFVGKIYSIFEEEEKALVEGDTLNQSSRGTAGVSSTAVELTELDTRRRTATGLVEEGRSPAGG